MDLLDAAMDIEQMSESFYEDMEQNTTLTSVKSIARMLADEERTHEAFIQEMKKDFKKQSTQLSRHEYETSVADYQQELTQKPPKDHSMIRLLHRGVELEEKSIEIYQSLKQNQESDEKMQLIDKLIKEEQHHRTLLDQLLEMTKNSVEWVEDPEFSHIGEDY